MLGGQLCADILKALQNRCNTILFMMHTPIQNKWVGRLGLVLLCAEQHAEGRLTVIAAAGAREQA